MIQKIFAILVVSACFLTTPAFSFDNDYRPYLAVGGGVSLLQETEQDHSTLGTITITGDPGFNGFIAAGRAYDVGRVEFSLGYNQAMLKEYEDSVPSTTKLKGNIDVGSLLVSLFWDFNKDGVVSPYFGGGVGICHIRLDDTILGDSSDGALAYQLGLGLNFNMGENTQLDLGYKMFSVVEPSLGPIDPGYLVMHNGNIAFRFLF